MTDHDRPTDVDAYRIEQIGRELDRIGTTDPADLDAPLPHIEGWTVHSVVGHTGWICHYVARCLTADPDDPPARADVPEPPAGPAVLDWFAEARSLVVPVIAATDVAAVRPTWTGPQPAGWWIRRLANEAAMHRWDTEAATTSPTPIDTELAVDGIDEVFEVFAPQRLDLAELDAAGASIHLHATDAPGEWMVRIGTEGLAWERAHEKGDVAARGPVSDLLLLLWSRIPPSRLECFGDAGLLDRWQQAARF